MSSRNPSYFVGKPIESMQYMLRVLSTYIQEIPLIAVDGIFGSQTRNAVIAAQRWFGLPQTGVVDFATWEEIFNQYLGIEGTSLRDFEQLPYTSAIINSPRQRNGFNNSAHTTQFPGNALSAGSRDPM